MTTPSRIVGEGARPRSGLGDLVSGAVSAVFGASVVLYVQGFPQLQDGSPGPALFPGIVGGLFTFFGLILVGRWVKDRVTRAGASQEQAAGDLSGSQPTGGEERQGDATAPIPSATAWINALAVVGSVVFYLLVVDALGFGLSMGICIFGLSWRLGARVRVALGSAVVTTTLIYLVFERLLQVPLPNGFLG